jgi:hypothetical protein
LAVQLLRQARAGHYSLMGKRNIPVYSSTVNPIWYQKLVNSKNAPYGKVKLDPDISGTNGEQLNEMKEKNEK